MPNSAGTAYVDVHPDLKGFGRELGRGVDPHVDKSAKNVESKFGGAFMSVAKVAGGAFVAAGVVKLGGELLTLGTQVETFGKKAKTVFEDSNADVTKWAKANASAFGITDDTLIGLTASFGDLLKPMGFTSKEAADMSTKVVGLSGALSAWSGGTRSAAEVSDILAKAMLGERDALKGLGISISEADITQRLFEKGQQDLTGAAKQQAEAVATQELIFEKSADAQKAWGDGSLDAVKKQNALKEKVAELKEDLAAKLLPAFAAVTAWIVDEFIPAFEKVVAWVQTNWPKIKRVIIETWDAIKSEVAGAFQIMQGIFQVGLSIITGDWSFAWNGVKDILSGAWQVMKDTVMSGVRFVINTILDMVGKVLEAGARLLGWAGPLGQRLKDAAADFQNFKHEVNASLGGIEDKNITLTLRARPVGMDQEEGRTSAGIQRASGGIIPGHGDGDTVPAWLTPGEFVIRKKAVQAIGVPALEQLNAKGYHSGGLVDFDWSMPGVGGIRDAAQGMFDEMADTATEAFRHEQQHLADERAAQRAALGGGSSASTGGLTSAAQAMVDAVLSRFPDQTMTSGYRSPEENARVGGAPNSDHMSGRAADFAPGSDGVASFLNAYPGIKQVLWQVSGHYDHVHGAVYDKGGWLQPGYTMAYNGTGQAERVSPVGGDVIDYDKLAAALSRVSVKVVATDVAKGLKIARPR